MKVKFKKTWQYNDVVYSAGETYELKNEPKGFIDRWVKRGCELVSKGEAKPDPRNKAAVKKAADDKIVADKKAADEKAAADKKAADKKPTK